MSKDQSNHLPLPVEDILHDYRLVYRSRQVSLIGRREVLSGKAKFGIFGAGKEVTQVAMARAFQRGDWRSGYYRDQTLVFALNTLSYQEYFAQLYAHADLEADPATAGRSMNGHFATRYINPDGSWKNQVEMYNMAADVSPTGSQMPRLVGLAYASRLYRELPELQRFKEFSNEGTEIAWGTIGNASTAEGMFWEAVNAIGVLKSPAIISIYDDGYGISVPNQFQMVKENISTILSGFQREPCPADCCDRGYDLYTVPAWDYATQLNVYLTAAEVARQYHVPALVHVIEMTQPQGHSTSGSHERYKSAERLAFEQEYDCLTRMRAWILANRICADEELAAWEEEDREFIEAERRKAWEAYTQPLLNERKQVRGLLAELSTQVPSAADAIQEARTQLGTVPVPLRRDLYAALQVAFRLTRGQKSAARQKLLAWKTAQDRKQVDRFQTYLHSETSRAATKIPAVQPVYSPTSPTKMAFEILNACFDDALKRDPRVVAFGEDVGDLGDVNQAFRGLQDKYGALRVSDTGIREVTILGQAIGLAMRGLRPIAEIQYLDYLLYGLQLLSDDLATLLWRTKG
ncbi:MAG: hypothetical protein JW862_07795, partial [Anaerolineales bacterium]|nr:hypothetical protein [Anaerolineales bacterium]